jgi:hypothetical protein
MLVLVGINEVGYLLVQAAAKELTGSEIAICCKHYVVRLSCSEILKVDYPVD